MALIRPTWTTRPLRPEELGGTLEHRFVSDEEFDELHAGRFFCQTGAITGLPYRYGLPGFVPHDDGPLDAVILRASYVRELVSLVPGGVVYQIQDRCDRMAARIEGRGSAPAECRSRIGNNLAESRAGGRLARRTFVNDGPLEAVVDSVLKALTMDFPGRCDLSSRGVAL